ncbi:Oidioi.mRNA.OKI2018_I69.PAR.g10559.t1.cds [Oikopleura dioica]|uniref:Oidioi.mRNA.OKI2018_I69.PAR.g10559.t1.cds n=1 Tax=Oikopleura dioica TaxID=34765 RepID=A0ABN7RUQ4_OIKDI|nr:Oidioi.mRNA.OKI2018_I69.PAR.g10559.t1.cds [Oikopleura dioica]
MDVFQRKKLNEINFTCEEIPFTEEIELSKGAVGDGDKPEQETVEISVHDQIKEILEAIKADDYSFEKRMKIKYIKRFGRCWVVNNNRKLFIAKYLNKYFGVNLSHLLVDRTGRYELSEVEQTQIMRMIYLHDEGKIFPKNFFPEVEYEKSEDRFLCEKNMFKFRQQYREEKKQEIPSWRAWLTVENLTANYPVFIFITVGIAILMQIGFIMVSPAQ